MKRPEKQGEIEFAFFHPRFLGVLFVSLEI